MAIGVCGGEWLIAKGEIEKARDRGDSAGREGTVAEAKVQRPNPFADWVESTGATNRSSQS